MKMDERFQIAMTPEEKEKLEELAAANTGYNKSLLLRKLIELAWESPKKFDLHPPKKKGHAPAPGQEQGT